MSGGEADGGEPRADETSPDAADQSRPYDFLTEALVRREADAFVHVGQGDDPTLRYLVQAGTDGSGEATDRTWRPSDRPSAFVCTDSQAWLCVPESTSTAPQIDVSVQTIPHDRHAGESAAAVLSEAGVSGTVLVPPHVPHDAALYLKQAGHGLASTRAVESARAVKDSGEVDRLRPVQQAATAGMARAGEVLAAATPTDDGDLTWRNDSLSATRLRSEINATLARHGVSDAANTRIEGELRPGAIIHVELAPRGPEGYHGALGRTFVIDGEGGWERRAHVAVTSARRVALAELEPETDASWIREETIAELGSFGFTVGAPDGGALPDAGGGIGLERQEAPSFRRDDDLEPGHVVRVSPGVRHEDHGTVRTVDVAVVTEDGAEWLTDAPTSLSPGAYSE